MKLAWLRTARVMHFNHGKGSRVRLRQVSVNTAADLFSIKVELNCVDIQGPTGSIPQSALYTPSLV